MKRRSPASLVFTASLALVTGVHCGSTTTTEVSGLPATLRLSELTAAQRETFCAWAVDPRAACVAAIPADAGAATATPVETCLAQFKMFSDCTVADYQACHDEALRDPCGAATTAACAALASCPASGPPTNESMSDGVAMEVCGLEMITGVGAMVWEVRRTADAAWTENCWSVAQTQCCCITYSTQLDHYAWEKDAICRVTPTYCHH